MQHDQLSVERQPYIQHWNVLFLARDRADWLDWFTPPEWRHVCAYGWSHDRWVVINAGAVHTVVGVMTDDQFDEWYGDIAPRITAKLGVPVAKDATVRSRFGWYCVSAVKHLIGSSSSALRPKALFRDLKRAEKDATDGRCECERAK